MIWRTYLLFSYMCLSLSCLGTTFHVGTGKSYASPYVLYIANVVNHNDTILIYGQTYTGQSALANWSKNNLVIKGVEGRPHLVANGLNIGGKGVWIVSGNNVSIDNIEFSGATVQDENGAGIRAENNDITIRNCYFHDNENGILTNNTNAGTVTIENCEFAYNGFGDGYSHNVYVGHNAKLIFQYNYSHHAKVGHNLKSRANENIILYNRIMDEATGTSSRLIDLPNGGFSLVMGNELMQGPLSENSNLVGYGLEGLTNTSPHFYFIHNTVINKRFSGTFLHVQNGTTISNIQNNIFGGIGTLISGPTNSISHNIIETDINELYFHYEPNYDYHATAISPGIDAAVGLGSVNGYSLTPSKEYKHPANYINRTMSAPLDIGASEYSPLQCNTTYSSYIFEGSYDNEWSNPYNWDNNCEPPYSFNGIIKIKKNCHKD